MAHCSALYQGTGRLLSRTSSFQVGLLKQMEQDGLGSSWRSPVSRTKPTPPLLSNKQSAGSQLCVFHSYFSCWGHREKVGRGSGLCSHIPLELQSLLFRQAEPKNKQVLSFHIFVALIIISSPPFQANMLSWRKYCCLHVINSQQRPEVDESLQKATVYLESVSKRHLGNCCLPVEYLIFLQWTKQYF